MPHLLSQLPVEHLARGLLFEKVYVDTGPGWHMAEFAVDFNILVSVRQSIELVSYLIVNLLFQQYFGEGLFQFCKALNA